MPLVCRLQVMPCISYDVASDEDAPGILSGAALVVQCDGFQELGEVAEPPKKVSPEELLLLEQDRMRRRSRRMEGASLPKVLRVATPKDKETAAENDRLCQEAYPRVREIIRRQGIPMRLTTLHYSFDRNMLLCVYAAEARVDFRGLIRELGATFNCHIEMRQIGARDESAIIGGIGICGRRLCCSTFLKREESGYAPQAKPGTGGQSIHCGLCGRVKCCHRFEEHCEMRRRHGGNRHDNGGGAEA